MAQQRGSARDGGKTALRYRAAKNGWQHRHESIAHIGISIGAVRVYQA
jgi:hypothetical protein